VEQPVFLRFTRPVGLLEWNGHRAHRALQGPILLHVLRADADNTSVAGLAVPTPAPRSRCPHSPPNLRRRQRSASSENPPTLPQRVSLQAACTRPSTRINCTHKSSCCMYVFAKQQRFPWKNFARITYTYLIIIMFRNGHGLILKWKPNLLSQ
jgi:hypothetical protein